MFLVDNFRKFPKKSQIVTKPKIEFLTRFLDEKINKTHIDMNAAL